MMVSADLDVQIRTRHLLKFEDHNSDEVIVAVIDQASFIDPANEERLYKKYAKHSSRVVRLAVADKMVEDAGYGDGSGVSRDAARQVLNILEETENNSENPDSEILETIDKARYQWDID